MTTYAYEPGGHGTDSTTGLIRTISQAGVTLTYAYDNRGSITSVSDGTKTTSYEYDAIGQLVRVNDPYDPTANTADTQNGTTWLFTYDLGGNILTKAAYPYTTGTVGTAAESHIYTYGNAGWKDQLTQLQTQVGTDPATTQTISYDAVGNPTSDGTWSYTWQHGRQLAQMSRAGETISFEYNEDGLRTKKTVTVGNETTVTEYLLHGKNVMHLTRGTDELHFYYDAQDRPAEVIFNGVAYGYLYNLQGDVVALVDETGAKVVEYSYDAWGKPISKTGSLAGTLGTLQPFRYRGYVFDEETALYYLRSRFYAPTFERFISTDILITHNIFLYCANDPINKIDPSGAIFEDFFRDAGDYFMDIWNGMYCRADAVLRDPSFENIADWLTMGYTGVNRYRYQQFVENPSFYSFSDWMLSGVPSTVKGAFQPEKPLSFDHWRCSLDVVLLAYTGVRMASPAVSDFIVSHESLNGFLHGHGFKVGNLEMLYLEPNVKGIAFISYDLKPNGPKFRFECDMQHGIHMHFGRGKLGRLHRQITFQTIKEFIDYIK